MGAQRDTLSEAPDGCANMTTGISAASCRSDIRGKERT